jgi:DNA-directed RNA polymerase specialized sigma24 family protein
MISLMKDDRPRPPKPLADLRASISRILRARGVPEQELEDRCQAVFLEAHAAKRVPPTEPARTRYIHGIARHVARKHRAALAGRSRELPYDEEESAVGVAAAPHDDIDLARRLHADAAARDPQGAEWLVRAKVHGEPETGIARQDGVPVDRVRKRISRLTATLRASSASLGVVASLFLVATFVSRWLVIARGPVDVSPPPVGYHGPSGQPVGTREAAERLRREGLEACRAGRWALCVFELDEARKLEPVGVETPEVQRARRAAEDRLHAPVNPDPK